MSSETIQTLLARVEAATFVNKSLMWDVCKTLNVDLGTIDNNGPTDIGGYIEARAWLSAAVALVEKVLPGAPWYVGVPTLGADHHKGKAGAAILHPSIMSFYNHRGFGPTPALALCAALLKALIAGERIGSESQAQTAIEQNKNLPPEAVE